MPVDACGIRSQCESLAEVMMMLLQQEKGIQRRHCGCAGTRQLAAPSSGTRAKFRVVAHRQPESWFREGARMRIASKKKMGAEAARDLRVQDGGGTGGYWRRRRRSVGCRGRFARGQRRSANVLGAM
jgi:hypothetical protein